MATNPYVNKVVYDGSTLIDLSSDTLSSADQLAQGIVAHDRTGAVIEGSIVIPSAGTEGTPVATKGTVSNHSISVTPSVTNVGGVIEGGTHTGTAVTVSASELVSGTLSVTSSGTKDVTNYASASIPSLTLPSVPSSTSSGTQRSIINPQTTEEYLNIPSGFNDTAQYYTIGPMVLDDLSVTENGTYDATDYSLHGFSSVTVNVSGGGGSSVATDVVLGIATTSSTLTFTGLKGEPTYFAISPDGQISTGSPSKISAIVYDGTTVHTQTITNTSNSQVTYANTGVSYTYNNGTLVVTSTNAGFINDEHYMSYAYNGSASNIHTADVQVGSGATSITFTGLEDVPLIWSCIFKSNFGTSSGYQRVIFTRYDGEILDGMAMDSSAHPSSAYWSQDYNNGSLTITSQGTNAGGYFHQPGYYQLTYVIGEASPYEKVSKTYRASTTAQSEKIEPSTGYDAMSEVNVTIPAVTQTNLTAANIKSGTTVTISNGSTNLWSVTGTYSGGGGSANIATATTTNSSNQNTSIDFTLPSGRTPIAFFARLTSQIARNSNSRYYYVYDMRWDGSSTGGVAGNTFYMYNGTLTNVTSGYSYSQSGTTFTLSSTGSRSASPGSFYNGDYELVYIY